MTCIFCCYYVSKLVKGAHVQGWLPLCKCIQQLTEPMILSSVDQLTDGFSYTELTLCFRLWELSHFPHSTGSSAALTLLPGPSD